MGSRGRGNAQNPRPRAPKVDRAFVRQCLLLADSATVPPSRASVGLHNTAFYGLLWFLQAPVWSSGESSIYFKTAFPPCKGKLRNRASCFSPLKVLLVAMSFEGRLT